MGISPSVIIQSSRALDEGVDIDKGRPLDWRLLLKEYDLWPAFSSPYPAPILFKTVLDVRISDINYGNNMANDTILRYAHEARWRFFQHFGYSERDVEGYGIIMADAAITYKTEVFQGAQLALKLGIVDINRHGFSMIYQAIDDKTGKEVARLQTGIVFFDYLTRKIALIPPAFLARIQIASGDKLS